MSASIKAGPVFLLAAILLLAAMALAVRQLMPHKEFPILGKPGPWAFTNQVGEIVRDANLDGDVWVASFMFTSCQGICPVMNKRLAEIYGEYKGPGGPRFVSFSVDPETDTVDALKEYAAQWDASAPQWNFLTGPVTQVHELAWKEFKVGSTSDPMDHSSRLIVVDREGQIRGYYDSLDEQAVKLLKSDLRHVLKMEPGAQE